MKKAFVGAAKWGIFVLLFIISVTLLFQIVSVFGVYSPSVQFNATPNITYMNWTAGRINVSKFARAGLKNLSIELVNSTTGIQANYSQSSLFAVNAYGNLTATVFDKCFDSTPTANQNMEFDFRNVSGGDNGTVFLYTGANRTSWRLYPQLACPPGRYYGNITIWNASNHTDLVNVTAIVDIPIGYMNTFNRSNMFAYFKGTHPTSNSTYHSYYFWTNTTKNVTGFTIKLTGFTEDMDMFLFTNKSVLTNQSTNKGKLDPEEFAFIRKPAGRNVWELRIYGNTTTNYIGYIYFNTLSITNASSANINYLRFGTINPNSSASVRFTINNTDDRKISRVNQSVSLYFFKKFINTTSGSKGYNANTSFLFLVPNFTEKLKVEIDWKIQRGKRMTNWDLYLYNTKGSLMNASRSKYLTMNVTNATRKEFIIFSGPLNTTNEGYWNATVKSSNITNASSFNITVYLWFNASMWITSNFTQNSTFNSTSGINSTRNVNSSIQVPGYQLISGNYSGHIQYFNGSGWKVRTPLSLFIKAGSLEVNGNVSKVYYRIYDNIGFNRTVYINVSINNTGSFRIYNSTNMTISNKLAGTKNANGTMTHSDSTGYFINFTIDGYPMKTANSLNVTSKVVGNGKLNISIRMNTSDFDNKIGVYTGYIIFNFTNAGNLTRQPFPYKTFNLTFYLNLSNDLNVTVLGLPNITNISNSMRNRKVFNITIKTIVVQKNGTRISSYVNSMNASNFPRIWLNESNITWFGGYLTNLAIGAATACGIDTHHCWINGTVPVKIPGGHYKIYVNTSFRTSSGGPILAATGLNATGLFLINDSGVNLSVTKTMGSIQEGGSTYLNVSVTNLGPAQATNTRVKVDISTCTVVNATASVSNIAGTCKGTTTSAQKSGIFNITVRGNQTTACIIKFKLTGRPVDADTGCTNIGVKVLNRRMFGNLTGIGLTVTNVAAGSGSSGSGDEGGGGAQTETKSVNIYSYESSISAVAGTQKSTDVVVENTGEASVSIKLDVTLSGINVTVDPSDSCGPLSNGETCTFNVTFSVPGDTKIGDHSGTLKAYVSADTTVYNKKSFTLTVQPTEEGESKIEETYNNYTSELEEIKAKIDEIRLSGIESSNLTKIELLYNDTLNMLNTAKEQINASDYVGADSTLKDVALNLERLGEELSKLAKEFGTFKESQWGNLLIWIMVAIVALVIIAIVAYMLLPQRRQVGYKPRKEGGGGFFGRFRGGSPGKGGTRQVLAVVKEAKEEKPMAYAGGYEKQSKKDVKIKIEGEGLWSRIGKKFRRKKKTQTGLYSFLKK